MRFIKWSLLITILVILSFTGWMAYFITTPADLQDDVVEVEIAAGSSLRSVSRQLAEQGVLMEPNSFTLLVRMLGMASEIKAGNYLIEKGTTPYDLFTTITAGKTTQAGITFIEGWTFRQMRQALMQNDAIRHLSVSYTDQQILKSIGAEETHPEGLFFPDTYYFSNGMSDLEILKRAYHAMRTKLNEAWTQREPGLPYKSPYEALIMASIIEKETGRAEERKIIAGVFVNRLRIGMRLQTDPTVIYGMGERFDGNIRRKDLQEDTAYNTYTRSGLPPTPIAMPGMASIEAALHPAKTQALYFVGKGDGSHVFSNTLAEHNRAVAKYQLKEGRSAR
jgi:UPF0755 protein